jgi:hypothetical protein
MDALSALAAAAAAYTASWVCEVVYYHVCAPSLFMSVLTRHSDFCTAAGSASSACAGVGAAFLGAGVAVPLRRWVTQSLPQRHVRAA